MLLDVAHSSKSFLVKLSNFPLMDIWWVLVHAPNGLYANPISYAVKSGSGESYAVYENSRGNVILEQSFPSTKGSKGMTIRTELSPDISKRLGYEQYIGGKLKVRSINTYSSSNQQTRSIGTPDGMSEDNPEKTVTEMIVRYQDGTPMIKVESKTYRTNRTVYNIK